MATTRRRTTVFVALAALAGAFRPSTPAAAPRSTARRAATDPAVVDEEIRWLPPLNPARPDREPTGAQPRGISMPSDGSRRRRGWVRRAVADAPADRPDDASDAAAAEWIVRGRVATTPWLLVDRPWTRRGDAAAATWIVRGWVATTPRLLSGRFAAAAARTVRGRGSHEEEGTSHRRGGDASKATNRTGAEGTMVLPLFPLGSIAYALPSEKHNRWCWQWRRWLCHVCQEDHASSQNQPKQASSRRARRRYTPGSTQVLNIFEPRYRKMYSDILMSGGRRFVTTMVPVAAWKMPPRC